MNSIDLNTFIEEGFTGTYQKSLDAKNRVGIPTELRQIIKTDPLKLVVWFDSGLALFIKSHWKQMARQLATMNTYEPETRAMRASFLGGSFDVDLDRGGRITLPEVLRNKVAIEKEVTLVGDWDKLLIFSSAQYAGLEGERGDQRDSVYETTLGRLYDRSMGQHLPAKTE